MVWGVISFPAAYGGERLFSAMKLILGPQWLPYRQDGTVDNEATVPSMI